VTAEALLDDCLAQKPLVSARGLARTYPGPAPVHALRPADLEVNHGEYVAVLGPSGSGKSTLLNLLGLLDRPTQGVYEFAGTDVAHQSERGRAAVRARHIGFVFQAFHLLPHRTTLENVMLGQLYMGMRRAERQNAASQALDQVGLSHRLHASPTTLSGGERQRAAIARALVNNPDLLLCDEPTGNLDSTTAATILDLFDSLRDTGLTLIVITHDQQVAARSSRKIAIHDGEIIDHGTRRDRVPSGTQR
jgi:putative ABC transport system ATP-binding protein